jgi:hypothetical protein
MHTSDTLAAASLDLARVESQAQAQSYLVDDEAEDRAIRAVFAAWRQDVARDPTRLAFVEALERRWLALDRRADHRVLQSAAEVQRLLGCARRGRR